MNPKTRSIIEPLEARIAPAAVFTFTDVDGDLVKITTTLGVNADLAAAATVVGGQLRLLDLRAAVFHNTNVTASVLTKSATGDGLVNIGRINASGRDLGNVAIAGDLGGILCGDGITTTPGLDLLSVRSMGLYGTATQGGGSDLSSAVEGALGALKVSSDLKDVSIGARSFGVSADGRLGSVSIGGSLDGAYLYSTGNMGPVKIGRDLLGGSASSSGVISCGGRLGSLTLGGSVIGGSAAFTGEISAGEIGSISIGHDIIGGSGDVSGTIQSGGKLTSLTVGGSLIGGLGQQLYNNGTQNVEGQIAALGDIGTIRIGNNLVGAAGLGTAKITGYGKIGSVSVGGSVLGGTGNHSAAIESAGDITALRIGFDLKGGVGDESGKIDSGGRLASLTIGGSVLGGAGDHDTLIVDFIPHTGQVYALTGIGPVKIGGDILGGDGRSSGAIGAGTGNDAAIKIGTVRVGGSILGGVGDGSGRVLSAGSIGAVTIGGNLAGGTGDGSGVVSANGAALTGIAIGGSLIGGGTTVNQFAGVIFSRGDMGAVAIGGDVLGGIGENSGRVSSFGKLARVSIGGSLVGGAGNFSGSIDSAGAIGSIAIGHDLLGGSISPGVVSLFGSGSITSQDRIASIVIGGSIVSGVDGSGNIVDGSLIQNATIRATRFIDSITVRGDVVGNVTPDGDSPVVISAGGRVGDVTGLGPSEVAIGKISIGGRVEWVKVLAGYNLAFAPVNADAQIGSVTVGADWIASSLIAGAYNTSGTAGTGDDNVNFGNANDTLIAEGTDNPAARARIGSIVIAGQVFGTPESLRPADSFGFVAEEIGALKVGARTFTLQPGPAIGPVGNDGFTIARRSDSILDDATLHEVGALFGFTLPAGAAPLLVNASTVTYADADGDRVTVKFSKPLLTPANVNTIFTFSSTLIGNPSPELQQLQTINVGSLQAHGLGIAVTVAPGGKGDGLAHVGAIYSIGYDLGGVVVPGDLGQIFSGSGTAARPGLASLEVRTLGRLGHDAMAAGGQQSVLVTGKLGALKVKQDIARTPVEITGAIGPISIGGSLLGGDGNDSGRISATGAIGAVKIGHHLQGGGGQNSGAIVGTGGIAAMSIGGSLLGSSGGGSGSTFGGVTGPVQIGHNVRGGTSNNSGTIGVEDGAPVTIGGSLLGGAGEFGARIVSDGAIGAVKVAHNVQGGAERTARIEGFLITSITIGGSLLGGGGATSGSLTASGDIGPVKIGRDILGGGGQESGGVFADGTLVTVTVGGTVLGSTGGGSGRIESALSTALVTIGRNVIGGVAGDSGTVFATGRLQGVTLGGSLVGGSDSRAGSISADGGMGAVKIGRDVHGGSSVGESGSIFARGGNLASVTIRGSLVGGSGFDSGEIFSSGDVGAVKIGGDVIGGSITGSGLVTVRGKLASLTLGGSLLGAASDSTGAVLGAEIATVKIGRNIVGGSIVGTMGTLDKSGYIESENRLAAITVGGSLFAGRDTSTGGSLVQNASIRAGDDMGVVTIRGSLHGNASSPIILSARGEALPLPVATRDLAIKSVSIAGSVGYAILAGGSDVDFNGVNGNAQLGPIAVRGDWLASSVSAGFAAGGDGFGNANDALNPGASATIVARIASIQIGGVVFGTAAAGDHFGFVAEHIGSFKSLGFTAPLTPGTNVIELSPLTGDVTIREV